MQKCIKISVGERESRELTRHLTVRLILPKNLPFCIADVVVNERCKYKAIADEMDQTFADLAGY